MGGMKEPDIVKSVNTAMMKNFVESERHETFRVLQHASGFDFCFNYRSELSHMVYVRVEQHIQALDDKELKLSNLAHHPPDSNEESKDHAVHEDLPEHLRSFVMDDDSN